MKTRNQFIIIAVLSVLGGTAWYYKDILLAGTQQTTRTQPTGGRPVPVQTAVARHGAVIDTIETVGTAAANEAVTVTTKTAGIVAKVHFTDGQTVRAGQVLIELDRREAQAELEASRAAVVIAQQNYDRASKLLGMQAVSQARMDELSSQLTSAQARIKVQEARVQDLQIVAPFNGKIGIRRVSVGAFVPPGAIVTTLDDIDPIKVSFQVPETVLALLKPGIAIKARSEAYSGQAFTGVVKTIDTRIDPATRTVEARAELPNPFGTLKPGLFMTVELSLARRESAILVPEEALIPIGTRQFVFVVKNGRALRTEVEVGQRIPGEVEIVKGIEVGTEIVTAGVQKIRDGSAVTPTPRPTS